MFASHLLKHQDLPTERHLVGILGAALVTVLGLATSTSSEASDARIQQMLNSSYLQKMEQLIEGKTPQRSRNASILHQYGSDNEALVNQSYLGAGPGNLAAIGQFGTANEAVIIQSGSGNTGLILQKGNDLSSRLTQNGDRFEAQLQQSGQDASIQLSQSGSGLRAIQIRQWAPSGAGARVTVDTR